MIIEIKGTEVSPRYNGYCRKWIPRKNLPLEQFPQDLYASYHDFLLRRGFFEGRPFIDVIKNKLGKILDRFKNHSRSF